MQTTESDRMPRLLQGSSPSDLAEAGKLLRQGALVVLPTDTGYALAASIFHPTAVERVFAVKQRDAALRLPVLIATAADIPLVARTASAVDWRLIGTFWPGPLSLVLPATSALPGSITGGRGTVAVRNPGGRTCLQVLEFLGEPVTGTSANISGLPGALTAADAAQQLQGTVDAIVVDDAAVVHPAASSVVEIKDGVVIVHREGVLSAERLRSAAAAHPLAASQLIRTRSRR